MVLGGRPFFFLFLLWLGCKVLSGAWTYSAEWDKAVAGDPLLCLPLHSFTGPSITVCCGADLLVSSSLAEFKGIGTISGVWQGKSWLAYFIWQQMQGPSHNWQQRRSKQKWPHARVSFCSLHRMEDAGLSWCELCFARSPSQSCLAFVMRR